MKTIVFTAQAFGFGPVSKMLAVSENISKVRKIFFGTGVAYDLAALHSFDEIHQIKPSESDKILTLLRRSDLIINVMDFSLSALVKFVRCPYFIIDVLLWFWPEKPERVECADIYFCQDFFGRVEQKIREYRLTNARVIDPIVSPISGRMKKRDQVMISFGGLECPWIEVGKNSNYPFIILENLLPILKKHFSRILVAGREGVMEMCRQKFRESDQIVFRMLSRMEFLQELSDSKALFTAPGSETFFDAYDKVPVFCLPPQNNSNFRNLDILIGSGAVRHYLHWPEVSDFVLPEHCTNDADEVRMVLEVIRSFEKNEAGRQLLHDKVKHFLEASESWPELMAQQKNVVNRFGVSGTESVVKAIEDVL